MRTLKILPTTEELIRLPTFNHRLELVKGELYELPLEGASQVQLIPRRHTIRM